MPRKVEHIYRTMLEKIDGFYREEAAWYLEMALYVMEGHFGLSSIDAWCIARYGVGKGMHLPPSHGQEDCKPVRERAR